MKTTSVFSLLALLALAGCGGHGDHTARPTLPTVTVPVTVVRTESTTRGQPLPGTVHPVDQAVVAAKIMATVEEASFAIGQKVTAGQVLVRLKADEINARAAQAEAGLAQIRRNYERESSLLAQGATTAETVRTLEDELRLAEARLAEARTMLTYTEVAAPFDGTITSKSVRRGDLATPGAPLLTIEGEGALRVHVQVPDSLTSVAPRDAVPIEAASHRLSGHVVEWSPAADPASRTRLAKLELPVGAPVRSGQFVRVIWPAETTEAVWIPRSAVRRIGQMDRVFTVANGVAHLRLIKIGAETPDAVQILAGLSAGDTLVASAAIDLRDGQPVTPQN